MTSDFDEHLLLHRRHNGVLQTFSRNVCLSRTSPLHEGQHLIRQNKQRPLLPLETLQAGIVMSGGLSGGGRLVQLHALAKDLRNAESRAEWWGAVPHLNSVDP
jgi:hypothetical protein